MEIKILDYLKSNSRNKIVIHINPIENIQTIDIGFEFTKHIQDLTDDYRFTLNAKSRLVELMNNTIYIHPVYGNILAIRNLGILFEKDLKFNFINFIENFSKTIPIFIEWKGEYDVENLYFQSREKGIKLNIKNLSHIFL